MKCYSDVDYFSLYQCMIDNGKPVYYMHGRGFRDGDMEYYSKWCPDDTRHYQVYNTVLGTRYALTNTSYLPVGCYLVTATWRKVVVTAKQ